MIREDLHAPGKSTPKLCFTATLPVVDRNYWPPNKEVHVLVSRTCEYIVLRGRRDHEDVIKDLEIWKLSWLIHCNYKDLIKGKHEGQREGEV